MNFSDQKKNKKKYCRGKKHKQTLQNRIRFAFFLLLIKFFLIFTKIYAPLLGQSTSLQWIYERVRGENFTVEDSKPRVQRTANIIKIEQEEPDVVANGGDLLSR
jgi:hypothetical protein